MCCLTNIDLNTKRINGSLWAKEREWKVNSGSFANTRINGLNPAPWFFLALLHRPVTRCVTFNPIYFLGSRCYFEIEISLIWQVQCDTMSIFLILSECFSLFPSLHEVRGCLCNELCPHTARHCTPSRVLCIYKTSRMGGKAKVKKMKYFYYLYFQPDKFPSSTLQVIISARTSRWEMKASKSKTFLIITFFAKKASIKKKNRGKYSLSVENFIEHGNPTPLELLKFFQ